MIAEVTAASLMFENKQMVHPASFNSTLTSVNQEGHVSMAYHGTRRLLAMSENLLLLLVLKYLLQHSELNAVPL